MYRQYVGVFLVGLVAGLMAFAHSAALRAAGPADQLAEEIETQLRTAAPAATSATPASVLEFQSAASPATWTERWPGPDGREVTRTVEALIWNAPIQAALAKHDAVFLPRRGKPYYLNEPIVLRSGQRLVAASNAELRLVPNTNTCMVRNEHLASGQQRPAMAEDQRDAQLHVEGGIWTTLATSRSQQNGNHLGLSSRQGGVPACHGVLMFNSVRGLTIKNVTVRQSMAHAIQLSNCREFRVEGVRFEEHRRDGVHINGPASFGVIRNIRGSTGDDFVALNAWDWRNTAPTFGPIHHLLVEDIHGDPQGGGTDEIRLLPGTKTYPQHAPQDCPVEHCVLRNLHDIRTIKIYDQPNLELGRNVDFCDPIGNLRDVYFGDLVFHRPGRFQVAVNVDGLVIDGVELLFDLHTPANANYRLVEIGPMSQTYKINPNNPATWVELFSPDRDVTVRRFRLTNVCVYADGKLALLPDAETRLVRIADQKLNPDYPKSTPRGGIGKAHVIRD